mgnify:FL=1
MHDTKDQCQDALHDEGCDTSQHFHGHDNQGQDSSNSSQRDPEFCAFAIGGRCVQVGTIFVKNVGASSHDHKLTCQESSPKSQSGGTILHFPSQIYTKDSSKVRND